MIFRGTFLDQYYPWWSKWQTSVLCTVLMQRNIEPARDRIGAGGREVGLPALWIAMFRNSACISLQYIVQFRLRKWMDSRTRLFESRLLLLHDLRLFLHPYTEVTLVLLPGIAIVNIKSVYIQSAHGTKYISISFVIMEAKNILDIQIKSCGKAKIKSCPTPICWLWDGNR